MAVLTFRLPPKNDLDFVSMTELGNLGFHAVLSTLEFTPAWNHLGAGGRFVEAAEARAATS